MDGVIRHWSTAHAAHAEDVAGLPRGVLAATAFSVTEFEQGLLGWVTFEDWCHANENALAARYSAESARIAVRTWHESRGDIDQRMVRLIRELREQVPIGLLSNAHDCLYRDLAVHNLTDVFDHVICSATVHLAKPDAAIYHHAAEVMGVPVAACFFTDDLESNIIAARQVGMGAEQFVDIDTLTRSLLELGLPTGR